MIEGFENITSDILTKEEESAKIWIAKILRESQRAVTSTDISSSLRRLGIEISSARIRKIIHNIRIENEVPNLLASSIGYYVCHDKEDIKRYVRSLMQRTVSIIEVTDAILTYNNITIDELYDDQQS